MESLKRLKEGGNEYATQCYSSADAKRRLCALEMPITSSEAFRRRAGLLMFGESTATKSLGCSSWEKNDRLAEGIAPYAKILMALAARREKQIPLAQKYLGTERGISREPTLRR